MSRAPSARSFPQLSAQSAQHYSAEHNLAGLFKALMTCLVMDQPQNPLHYVSEKLASLAQSVDGAAETRWETLLNTPAHPSRPPTSSSPNGGVPGPRPAGGSGEDSANMAEKFGIAMEHVPPLAVEYEHGAAAGAEGESDASREEVAAAVKIQAVMRGHMTRKALAEGIPIEQAAGANVSLGDEAAGQQEDVRIEGDEFGDEQAAEEERAAVKIQAMMRGHLTRKALAAAGGDDAGGEGVLVEQAAVPVAEIEDDVTPEQDAAAVKVDLAFFSRPSRKWNAKKKLKKLLRELVTANHEREQVLSDYEAEKSEKAAIIASFKREQLVMQEEISRLRAARSPRPSPDFSLPSPERLHPSPPAPTDDHLMNTLLESVGIPLGPPDDASTPHQVQTPHRARRSAPVSFAASPQPPPPPSTVATLAATADTAAPQQPAATPSPNLPQPQPQPVVLQPQPHPQPQLPTSGIPASTTTTASPTAATATAAATPIVAGGPATTPPAPVAPATPATASKAASTPRSSGTPLYRVVAPATQRAIERLLAIQHSPALAAPAPDDDDQAASNPPPPAPDHAPPTAVPLATGQQQPRPAALPGRGRMDVDLSTSEEEPEVAAPADRGLKVDGGAPTEDEDEGETQGTRTPRAPEVPAPPAMAPAPAPPPTSPPRDFDPRRQHHPQPPPQPMAPPPPLEQPPPPWPRPDATQQGRPAEQGRGWGSLPWPQQQRHQELQTHEPPPEAEALEQWPLPHPGAHLGRHDSPPFQGPRGGGPSGSFVLAPPPWGGGPTGAPLRPAELPPSPRGAWQLEGPSEDPEAPFSSAPQDGWPGKPPGHPPASRQPLARPGAPDTGLVITPLSTPRIGASSAFAGPGRLVRSSPAAAAWVYRRVSATLEPSRAPVGPPSPDQNRANVLATPATTPAYAVHSRLLVGPPSGGYIHAAAHPAFIGPEPLRAYIPAPQATPYGPLLVYGGAAPFAAFGFPQPPAGVGPSWVPIPTTAAFGGLSPAAMQPLAPQPVPQVLPAPPPTATSSRRLPVTATPLPGRDAVRDDGDTHPQTEPLQPPAAQQAASAEAPPPHPRPVVCVSAQAQTDPLAPAPPPPPPRPTAPTTATMAEFRPPALSPASLASDLPPAAEQQIVLPSPTPAEAVFPPPDQGPVDGDEEDGWRVSAGPGPTSAYSPPSPPLRWDADGLRDHPAPVLLYQQHPIPHPTAPGGTSAEEVPQLNETKAGSERSASSSSPHSLWRRRSSASSSGSASPHRHHPRHSSRRQPHAMPSSPDSTSATSASSASGGRDSFRGRLSASARSPTRSASFFEASSSSEESGTDRSALPEAIGTWLKTRVATARGYEEQPSPGESAPAAGWMQTRVGGVGLARHPALTAPGRLKVRVLPGPVRR
ncbi:hypothetical protein PAPYR_9916 [Paratrimastix pyriformis]|uniref:Uncharacterized protein n=1 Tax=Paratrimastix pyriformis TaxID=342808 RepID=A0ABQ8U771_9EUKA|nr:hypothetical protein PAPYR_9916 [Paratrimastix pyriformis]